MSPRTSHNQILCTIPWRAIKFFSLHPFLTTRPSVGIFSFPYQYSLNSIKGIWSPPSGALDLIICLIYEFWLKTSLLQVAAMSSAPIRQALWQPTRWRWLGLWPRMGSRQRYGWGADTAFASPAQRGRFAFSSVRPRWGMLSQSQNKLSLVRCWFCEEEGTFAVLETGRGGAACTKAAQIS